MNPVKVITNYSALSPPQREIVNSKLVQLAMPPEAWLRFLERLAELDEHGDRTRKAAGALFIISLIVGFLLFIAAANNAAPSLLRPPVFVVLGLVALFFGVVYLFLRRMDLSNNLRSFVLPLLTVLREDMDGREKLSLDMDLRGPERDDKQVGDTQTYSPGGNVLKVKETHFADPWMIGKARLHDGGLLEWRIEDKVRRRKMTKRNYRGKIKFKTKHKVKRAIDVRLSLPRKTFVAGGDGGGGLDMREGEKRTVFKNRHTVVYRELGAVLDIREFLDAVGQVYNQVQPARQEGRS